MQRYKDICLTVLTAVVIVLFSAAGIVKTPKQYSLSERRALAQKPELSAERLMSGKLMSDFEDFALDQFPLRDGFRSLKAVSLYYIFRQKDNHGLYLSQGHLSKLEYPLNTAKWNKSVDKLRDIYNDYLSETECRIFLSMIPDKNCFLAPQNSYLHMDYDKLADSLSGELDFASYIDISDELSLDAFYKTDQHWRQERILDAAEALADGMGTEISLRFKENILNVPFYGAYYGQAALKLPPDTIHYLTSDILDSCTVTSFNKGVPAAAAVYDMDKAHGRDPYEMFLSGSDALITIENPAADSSKELIVFRDSFAGSIIPLIVSGYSKITLVDLRYLKTDMLGEFIEFKNQDILFLYSTLILNSGISA